MRFDTEDVDEYSAYTHADHRHSFKYMIRLNYTYLNVYSNGMTAKVKSKLIEIMQNPTTIDRVIRPLSHPE